MFLWLFFPTQNSHELLSLIVKFMGTAPDWKIRMMVSRKFFLNIFYFAYFSFYIASGVDSLNFRAEKIFLVALDYPFLGSKKQDNNNYTQTPRPCVKTKLSTHNIY